MSDYEYEIDYTEFEDEGFRVNMSDKEAESEARDFTPLPKGAYHCAITDVTLEQVKSGKNEGKPMLNFEFTVQEGQYDKRKVFARAMLWEGALYTISQMLKAVGIDPKRGVIPPAEWWQGKHMVVLVKLVQKQAKDPSGGYVLAWDDADKKKPTMTNDTNGFKPMKEWQALEESTTAPAGKASSGGQSLLPG